MSAVIHTELSFPIINKAGDKREHRSYGWMPFIPVNIWPLQSVVYYYTILQLYYYYYFVLFCFIIFLRYAFFVCWSSRMVIEVLISPHCHGNKLHWLDTVSLWMVCLVS